MDMMENTITQPNCPDCGTTVGNIHRTNCDVERCSKCLQQKLFCGCDSDHTVWNGEWPESLQYVKEKYDALVGLESEWEKNFSSKPSVIYRSPTGFPLVRGTIFLGNGDRLTMNFGWPTSSQQDWLDTHSH